MKRVVAQLAVGVALGWVSGITLGQEGTRPLDEVVKGLDAASFEVREAAEFELIDFPQRYPLGDLEKRLADPALSPEQRLRLERAAYRRFADSPRGALGVTLNEVDAGEGRLGVAVTSVRETFPAAKVLREGDVIIKIAGEGMGRVPANMAGNVGMWGNSIATSMLRTMVISHDPGNEVAVTVLRRKAPDAAGAVAVDELNLNVTLGDFKRLQANAVGGGGGGIQNGMIVQTDLYEPELRTAWQRRLARIGPAPAKGIDARGLRMAQTSRGNMMPEAVWVNGRPVDVIDASARGLADVGEAPAVVAGGAPDPRRTEEPTSIAKSGGFQPFNQGGGWGGGAGGGWAVGFGDLDNGVLQRMTDAELASTRRRLASWVFALRDQPLPDGRNRGGLDVRIFEKQLQQTTAELKRRADAREKR